MTVSRAESGRRWRLVAPLLLASMIGAGSASVEAQGLGPPVRLGPAGDVPAPVAGVGAGAEALPTFALPDAAGVTDTGLGPTVWAGTPFPVVQRLLGEVPVAAPSPAQRLLTIRLLMAGTEPPAGDTGGYRLAAPRVAKLAALGAVAEVARLVAVIPGAFGDETIARGWVEAHLVLAPDTLECSEVARLAQGFGGGVWPSLVSACRGVAEDFVLPVDPGVAELVLARAAGLAVRPAATAPIRDPLRLVALARADGTSTDIRVDAAERAAAAGALSATELAAIYADLRFAPAVLARPLSSTREGGARSRALVYQALVGETEPLVRAELLRHAFEILESAQAVGPVAAVPLAILAAMPVDATTRWLAPVAVRAFALQGRLEAAGPWREAAGLARLWPVLTLGPEGAPGDLVAWLRLALEGADAGRRARVAGVVALLQAAGESVNEDAWTLVGADVASGKAALPSVALWQTLQSATAAHRVGEVVLAALVMLGDGGPQALPPVVLAQIVASLSAVGLAADARALAREAIAALVD